MKKIPKKYSGILMGATMGFLMSSFMSFIVTTINLGLTDGFFLAWKKAFCFSFPIAISVALVLMPFVKRFVERITE